MPATAGQAAVGPDGHPNPQVTLVPQGLGQPTIYGFAIPLEVAVPVLPKDAGFTLRIDLFVRAPGCDAMGGWVQPHTSPGLRPRLELATANPLRVVEFQPQAVGDALVLHASVLSAWGGYDVATEPGQLYVDVDGRDGPMARLDPVAVVQRIHEFGHHTDPVRATFVWPHAALGVPDGPYAFTLRARTLQGAATAQATTAALVEAPRPPPCPALASSATPPRAGGTLDILAADDRHPAGCNVPAPAPAGQPTGRSTFTAPLGGAAPLAVALLGLAAATRLQQRESSSGQSSRLK